MLRLLVSWGERLRQGGQGVDHDGPMILARASTGLFALFLDDEEEKCIFKTMARTSEESSFSLLPGHTQSR